MIKVSITFRDDTETIYKCNDFPVVGDTWTTLYLDHKDQERLMLRSESIAQVRYWVSVDKS